jgi:CDGSH-type Zn-finger protein/uncharacterized Fe-S cluster protein YjdI
MPAAQGNEPEIITHEREELAYLLTEAAEIEHGLMCCYLYAAYSLKVGTSDDLAPEEAAAVARWRAAIVDVAIDEMLHLAIVSNLLAAIGSPPHFQRPNFPVAPGYHPAGVVVALAPFDRATLDHFIYLERPEGVTLPDGAGFEAPAVYERAAHADRLVPSAQDYATVGHLYRGIRSGFEKLADRMGGEKALFVGDPAAQVGTDIAPLPGLVAVTDVASAKRAIDTIVDQGEGAPGHSEGSHYARFMRVRDELDELTRARPRFSPAHPAARNPVMRKPPEPRGKVHVVDPGAARVLDLGNAVYAFSLRCLARAFGEADDPPAARARLVESSFAAMRELGPLMQLLATMPANPAYPGATAGLTFTMQRSTVGFSQQRAAWAILAERAREIAKVGESVGKEVHRTAAQTAETFARVARTLEGAAPGAPAAARTALPVAPPPAVAPAAPAPANELAAAPAIEEARTPGVVLRFEGKRCIHSRQCVLGAPDVFLANVKGPWLHPEAVSVDEIAAIAQSCPSGAITYERVDGGPQEKAPKVNVVRIRENGPLAVQASLELEGRGSMFRATLCRCGASKNKPFCDGSHVTIGFTATGEPATVPTDPLEHRDGALRVLPLADGPLQVTGNLEICAGTGRTVKRVTSARLCRCGGSANKPFCDGTHVRIGFRSE